MPQFSSMINNALLNDNQLKKSLSHQDLAVVTSGNDVMIQDSSLLKPHNPVNNTKRLYDIEWDMLDKSKYFPYTAISNLGVRTLLYPLTLVRTRLQIQLQNTVYKGTWDALKTIYTYEGFFALYKSFLFYNLQLIPNIVYITSFEKIRQHVSNYTSNNYTKAMIAGGLSSMVSQTMVVPIDVVTQHVMLVGQKASKNAQTELKNAAKISRKTTIERIHVPIEKRTSNYSIIKYICCQIYKSDKIFGFFRGYFVSSSLMGINSSLWWPFYFFYQEQFKPVFPTDLPPIVLQSLCAPMSTLTSNVITNPLDVIRARMQISKDRQSYVAIVNLVWQQERFNLFFKGLTARLTHSMLYSFFIMLGYESVKKMSLKEEYKELYY